MSSREVGGSKRSRATTPRKRNVSAKKKKVPKPPVARTTRKPVKAKVKPPVQAITKPSDEVLREALALRAKMKRARPSFRRHESWRFVRIRSAWRRPTGIDNKMRMEVKGWPKKVKIGYRGPAIARGLHPSGKRDVLVHNISELEQMSPERDAARLAGALGRRNRIGLVSRAKELGIKVLNPGRLRAGKKKVAS